MYLHFQILGLADKFYPNFNRRNLHQWSQVLVIIGFLGVSYLFYIKYEGPLLLALNLVGSVCTEYTWDACYLCGIEAVPSEVRSSAIGTFSLAARIGSILSPIVSFFETAEASENTIA